MKSYHIMEILQDIQRELNSATKKSKNQNLSEREMYQRMMGSKPGSPNKADNIVYKGGVGGCWHQGVLSHRVFLPEVSFGLLVLSLPTSVSLCVRLSVCSNHELVHAITHHPFKLGSLNLDQRRKKSLLFYGAIDHDLQDQIVKI